MNYKKQIGGSFIILEDTAVDYSHNSSISSQLVDFINKTVILDSDDTKKYDTYSFTQRGPQFKLINNNTLEEFSLNNNVYKHLTDKCLNHDFKIRKIEGKIVHLEKIV